MARYLKLGLVTVFSCGIAAGCSSTGDTGGSGSKDGGGNGISDASGDGSGNRGGGAGFFFGAGGGGSTSGSGSTSGAGADSGVSGAGGGSITSVTTITSAAACVSQKDQANPEALDIFIMQDRSGSMGDKTANGQTKWTVITNALSAFVNDKASAGIGAGIGFFSVSIDFPDGGSGVSCDAADYAKPAVPIAALNGNAAAIVKAIKALSPGDDTPTEPALEGAIDYAQTWKTAHPTHKVIVVFATDGLPHGCNSTIAGAAAIAKTGDTGAKAIQTYVVGVFGSKDCSKGLTPACTVVQNTNAIAKGGGTGSAFIVDTGGNTEAQFVSAMNAIRNANSVSCDYTIPPAPSGKAIDPTHATVQYTSGTKAPQNLVWSKAASTCSATTGGWYYDSVSDPSRIHLCPSTCTKVTADPLANIQILLACEPPGSTGPGAGGASGAGGGTGAGGTGAGGTASGNGGSGGATSTCLLEGQSCDTASDCCSHTCTSGLCQPLVH